MASSFAKHTCPNVPLPIGSRMYTSIVDGTIRRLMDVEENGEEGNADDEDDSESRDVEDEL